MALVLLIALPLLAAALAWLVGMRAARLLAPVIIGLPLAACCIDCRMICSMLAYTESSIASVFITVRSVSTESRLAGAALA